MKRLNWHVPPHGPITAHPDLGGTEGGPGDAPTDPAALPYLAKPFTEAPAPNGSLCYGLMVLDYDRYAVHVEGQRVSLTRLEFDLLAFLARHPDRVVSHPELMRNVVGRALGDGASVIRVHVSHLRKKLGRVAGVIRTVRGRGLMFDTRP